MKFNFDVSVDIEVDTEGDAKLIRFGNEDTLGVSPTSHGFTLTPDWTGRRFTMAFPKHSGFYHVTEEEGLETKRNEERHLSRESIMADIYSGLRSIGPVVPADWLGYEWLYRWDIEGITEYFEREDVVEKSANRLRVKSEEKDLLITEISNDPRKYKEWVENTLTRFCLEDAIDSSMAAFISPSIDELIIIYPDEYACVIALEDLGDIVLHLEGSMVWDSIREAIIDDELL